MGADPTLPVSPGSPLPPLLLIGCGKMGGAMLSGWMNQGLGQTFVVEPHAAAIANPGLPVTIVAGPELVPAEFEPAAVVCAVKPQSAAAVLPHYAKWMKPNTLFISIMAGLRTEKLAGILGVETAMVRAMPNTPAAVRRGFTCCYGNALVAPSHRDLADRLLSAVGEVAWVDSEAQLDPVTAISGGGPAYVFLLAEALEAAAIEQGLAPDLARRMARSTIIGSGMLLDVSVDDCSQLRRNVTSPGGTTERALRVLMNEDRLLRLMSQAMSAATERSRELAE
jgi:pyrroline-5-carboxylate reductase